MKYIEIGKISRPHGLKGSVLIPSREGKDSALAYVDEISLGANQEQLKSYAITKRAWMPKGWKITLESVSRIEEAEPFRDFKVFVRRDQLQQADENEFYVTDLEGLEVVDADTGNVIGTFSGIESDPMSEQLQERWLIEKNGEELTIPANQHFIKEVDTTNRKIFCHHLSELCL